ncbi:MAG: amino acid ABC transporter permease [Anaerolineales bacterium]|nr:amino acid ABC transporter permease [Anaerolineales bacterium]
MATSQETLETGRGATAQPIHIQQSISDRLAEFPWWILILLLAGVLFLITITTNADYQEIVDFIIVGVIVTVRITIYAWIMAQTIGLLTALGQLTSKERTERGFGGFIKWWLRVAYNNLATLYVQVIRGVPTLVLIFYVGLFAFPAVVVPFINWVGSLLAGIGPISEENALATMTNRDISFEVRGIVALAISYGAFSSEIYRAGIQSIERGQIDAAKALGLSWFKIFRHIVFPQAIRRILPPMGNDFIALLKESSLVGVLGVGEITQLGRKYASASFQFSNVYVVLAYLYLVMTLLLSMGVKFIERRMKTGEET